MVSWENVVALSIWSGPIVGIALGQLIGGRSGKRFAGAAIGLVAGVLASAAGCVAVLLWLWSGVA